MDNTEKREIAISFIRSAFSAVPYAGQLLNEIFFEFRGRIQQERFNRFTQLLSEYFSKHGEINFDNLKTEEFSDLLESVLLRVIRTKSAKKHERFRDILVNQMINPETNIDNAETYLDLVHSLSEIEIKILSHHQIFDKYHNEEVSKFEKLKSDLVSRKTNLSKEKEARDKGYANNYLTELAAIQNLEILVNAFFKKLEKDSEVRTSSFYHISDDDFLYYKQSLQSKGLLIDTGSNAYWEIEIYQVMSITEFGKKFINFIINSEETNQ